MSSSACTMRRRIAFTLRRPINFWGRRSVIATCRTQELKSLQHYVQCFNIRVEGSGTSKPNGVVFPGAYKPFRQEPGLYFDIWRHVSPYPIPGPPLYVSSGTAPQLKPLPPSTQSPTGDAAKDRQYFAAVNAASKRSDDFTASVNARHLGYGGDPEMASPPPGSVQIGAVVRGAKWRATENGLAGVEA